MSTLTEVQHRKLDRIADARPDAKVVGVSYNRKAEAQPVLLVDGARTVVERSGRLRPYKPSA